MREQVGIFHQRQRVAAHIITQSLRYIFSIGVAATHVGIELLKMGGASLLTGTVVGVEGVEQAVEPFFARQRLQDGSL